MDGGPSGLMYILRADALEAQLGDSPDLSTIYAPGTPRQARRRLVSAPGTKSAVEEMVGGHMGDPNPLRQSHKCYTCGGRGLPTSSTATDTSTLERNRRRSHLSTVS